MELLVKVRIKGAVKFHCTQWMYHRRPRHQLFTGLKPDLTNAESKGDYARMMLISLRYKYASNPKFGNSMYKLKILRATTLLIWTTHGRSSATPSPKTAKAWPRRLHN